MKKRVSNLDPIRSAAIYLSCLSKGISMINLGEDFEPH